MKPDLTVLRDTYAIYRLDSNAQIPALTENGDFLSFTRTIDEVSLVCRQKMPAPEGVMASEFNWKIIRLAGPLEFELTGIISGITSVLAENDISLFTISTFNTDYILVREHNLVKAMESLAKNGYLVSFEK